jgi:hypothetical protein
MCEPENLSRRSKYSYWKHLLAAKWNNPSGWCFKWDKLKKFAAHHKTVAAILRAIAKIVPIAPTEQTLKIVPDGSARVCLSEALLHNYSVFRPKALLRRLFSIRLSN